MIGFSCDGFDFEGNDHTGALRGHPPSLAEILNQAERGSGRTSRPLDGRVLSPRALNKETFVTLFNFLPLKPP